VLQAPPAPTVAVPIGVALPLSYSDTVAPTAASVAVTVPLMVWLDASSNSGWRSRLRCRYAVASSDSTSLAAREQDKSGFDPQTAGPVSPSGEPAHAALELISSELSPVG
jgi:hypothetical protein